MNPLASTDAKPKNSLQQTGFTLVVVIFVVTGLLHMQGRAIKRAAIYNNRRFELQRAYTNYQATGNLPPPFGSLNPIAFSIFTNTVTLDGTNHQCALGVDWFPGHGLLVITTNHVTLWLDNKHGPKLVDHKYQPRFFPPGF